MIGRLLRFFVATLMATTGLVALLPAAGRSRIPPTVVREVRVDLEGLLPSGARVRTTADGLVAREGVWTREARTCAPIHFTMAGLVWQQEGTEPVHAELSWGSGESAEVDAVPAEGPDPSSPDWTGLVGTDPVWTDGADCLRFRLRVPEGDALSGLRVAFINTSGTADGRKPAASSWGLPPASAMTRRPGLVRRKEWGANESLRNCRSDYADRVRMAFVHHTVNDNNYARGEADDLVRGIYAYHTNSLGYCDIAYNFLIDRFGRAYEGRSGGVTRPVIGAHAMGFNTGSTGVAALGDFQRRGPSRAMLAGYRRLLAWRLDVAHVEPTGWATMTSAGGSNQRFEEGERVRLRAISGHRDTGYTVCPGDRLYRKLPSIRSGAEARGLPKIWRPRASRSRITVRGPESRLRATLSGKLIWRILIRDRDGTLVRLFHGRGAKVNRTWRGTDLIGKPVKDGRYLVTFAAENAGGGTARRARLWIVVARR
jgi:hypothetical protein